MTEVCQEERHGSVLDLKRYSSWVGAVRVMAENHAKRLQFSQKNLIGERVCSLRENLEKSRLHI